MSDQTYATSPPTQVVAPLQQAGNSTAKLPNQYNFSASVIGAAAHCHTVYGEKTESEFQVPSLGASVLSSIGGLSKSELPNRSFEIPYAKQKTNLLSFHRIKTRAEGAFIDKQFRTEIEADIESISFADKLHIDSARLYVLSTRDEILGPTYVSEPTVRTQNRITGIRLGAATVLVDLDDNLLPQFATAKKIETYLKNTQDKRIQSYDGESYFFSLVSDLRVVEYGEPIVKIAPNILQWKGFGTIYFGEVIVKGDERQVTLVRVEMDGDIGGAGTVGPGSSNGSAGST